VAPTASEVNGGPRGRVSRLGEVCIVVLVLAACSGSSSSSGTTTTATSAAFPVPGTAAIGTVSLTGDPAVSGLAGDVSIRCGFPNLKGVSIAVLGKAYDTTTDMRIAVRANNITVQLSTGTGTDFHERAFEGTGVTEFDPAKGAQIDSPLNETLATAGTTGGAVPAITSIKGSVDCRGQKPGASTLTLTGATAEGQLTAATLDNVRVECNTDSLGNEVSVVGIATIGSVKAFMSIGLRVDGTSISELTESGAARQYQAPAGSAAPTPTGGHASGDAVEQKVAPPHVIHVEGDVTCGSA
jgi:hypothetical protein